MPERKSLTVRVMCRKNGRSVARPAVTGWRMVCQVRKPPSLLADLPASPGEFNLACRERPAAKPAAMEIFHHGIDLLGNFRAVVRLAAPVADVRSGHPGRQ
jgi:hypothetical protein